MIAALATVTLLLSVHLWAAVPEPADYRGEPYRSEVPDTLEGAIVISTETAYALWRTERVVFIDVLPHTPRPKNLPEGTIWRDTPRHTIPGAIWLPNTGYQQLADETRQYLLNGLHAVTKGDMHVPVVFFCLQDCWMSWNAAKRALALGYTRIFWYPEGTDGWEFNSYPVKTVHPWSGE